MVIILLLVKNYLDDVRNGQERDRLMKGIMAKNLREYEDSVTIKEPVEPVLPKDISMDEADENLFKKHLQSILDGEQSADGTDTES